MPRIGESLKLSVLAIGPSGSKTGNSISLLSSRVYQGSLTPLSTSKSRLPSYRNMPPIASMELRLIQAFTSRFLAGVRLEPPAGSASLPSLA